MGDGFPIAEAILTDSFAVSVVWGFHIVSLGFCMHALLMTQQKRSAKNLNWGMAAVSWILFINATFDMVIAVHHIILAFISTNSPEDAAKKYAVPDWTNVARTTSVVIQTIIGDTVLIYRCWIVYDRSFLVITPSVFLWLGLIGSTIWTIFLEATLNVLFNANQITHAITTFWSITIVLNIITTGLLVYRIWSVENSNRKHRLDVVEITGEDRLRSVKNIIIESGLLYTISAIVTFGTYIGGSDSIYLTSGVEVQVVGIAFNLIIVRTTNLSRRRVSMRVDTSRGPTQSFPLQFASVNSAPRDTNSKTEIYVSSSVIREVPMDPVDLKV